MRSSRRKHGENPISQLLVQNILLQQTAHVVGEHAKVGGVPSSAVVHDLELPFAFMSRELTTQFFRMLVDVGAQLRQNAKPDVVRADADVVMLVISFDDRVDEPVARRDDARWKFRLKRGLEELVTFAALRWTSSFEDFLCICSGRLILEVD